MHKFLHVGTTKYVGKIPKHLKVLGEMLMDFIYPADEDSALF
jgi:hypothetical protein